jgi:predicted DNA binding CopG/RHH family protein
MRPIQYFSEEYLNVCQNFSTGDILNFIENFKILTLGSKKAETKLISIKIETDLLELFKRKANLENKRYQTKIKELMKKYCLE